MSDKRGVKGGSLVDGAARALTAGALASERQRATAVGMNDFTIKPFDAPTLVATVRRHARRLRVRAPASLLA